MKKLSKAQQAALDNIRVKYHQHKCGIGGMPHGDNLSQADKRLVKLHSMGFIYYVGFGEKSRICGYVGGCGLIPAEAFDPAKHTKLEPGQNLNWESGQNLNWD